LFKEVSRQLPKTLKPLSQPQSQIQSQSTHHIPQCVLVNRELSTLKYVTREYTNHKLQPKPQHKHILEFDRDFQIYLKEIEEVCGHKLLPEQVQKLKEHIDTYEYTRLSPEESKQHRQQFNKRKPQIIAEFEEHYGRKWKTYEEDMYNKHGKIVRQKGAKYDAHHIILSSWKGSNEWWNMIDLEHPAIHPDYIHRKGGACDRIFGH
jgi:hypothetical protein